MILDLEVTWNDENGNLYSWIGGTHIKKEHRIFKEINLHETSILALKEATKEIIEDLLR